MDGPLAPFEGAQFLRQREGSTPKRRPLFHLLLEIRNAGTKVLEQIYLPAPCCRTLYGRPRLRAVKELTF
jgi:hypothetical protein